MPSTFVKNPSERRLREHIVSRLELQIVQPPTHNSQHTLSAAVHNLLHPYIICIPVCGSIGTHGQTMPNWIPGWLWLPPAHRFTGKNNKTIHLHIGPAHEIGQWSKKEHADMDLKKTSIADASTGNVLKSEVTNSPNGHMDTFPHYCFILQFLDNEM